MFYFKSPLINLLHSRERKYRDIKILCPRWFIECPILSINIGDNIFSPVRINLICRWFGIYGSTVDSFSSIFFIELHTIWCSHHIKCTIGLYEKSLLVWTLFIVRSSCYCTELWIEYGRPLSSEEKIIIVTSNTKSWRWYRLLDSEKVHDKGRKRSSNLNIIYPIFEFIIGFSDGIHSRIIHSRYMHSRLIYTYLLSVIISSCIGNESTYISERFLIDELVELLEELDDHWLSLDIWHGVYLGIWKHVRSCSFYPKSINELEFFLIEFFVSCIYCSYDISEEVLTEALIYELLCTLHIDFVGTKLLYIKTL